jgi:hypothetical protein
MYNVTIEFTVLYKAGRQPAPTLQLHDAGSNGRFDTSCKAAAFVLYSMNNA